MKVGRRTIEIGNPDKELFPDAGITKRDVADYYRRVGDALLPHARGRPITLHRFPDGIGEEGFYQKQVPDYFPDWIRTESIATRDDDEGALEQLLLENSAALVFLADQGCIVFHAWLSRVDQIERPDRLVFDLDPPDRGDPAETFGDVRRTARWIRELLDEVGLLAYVQTSGSRGLHLHTPLDRSADFETARTFAGDLVSLLERRHPDSLTTAQRKKKRGGKIYLDVARNAYGQTAVLPYSLRARPGAPVATPLDWDELGATDLDPRRYTLKNLFRRLGRVEDPWKGMGRHARSLKEPRARLDELLQEATDENSTLENGEDDDGDS